jgi:hypothetical protein
MHNLELWNSVSKTDPNYTRNVDIGPMSITSIDPHYQRKLATEVFGVYGIGWYLSDELITTQTIDSVVLATYMATFRFVCRGEEGQFPVTSSIKVSYITKAGKLIVDDDYSKKLQTDALTKGLSFLGFNADVFEGKFDDVKYVKQLHDDKSEKLKIEIENTFSEEISSIKEAVFNDDQVGSLWAAIEKQTKASIWNSFNDVEKKVIREASNENI